jgi:sporulation protein YlmC with PRC-barrel domain
MIRASDLIGCRVWTESGQKVGRVHDLRAQSADHGWLLIGLVVGRAGILERLRGGPSDGPTRPGAVIPWQAITALHDGRITIRDRDSDAS